MKTWDAWFPDVLVHATSAPHPLVSQALCRSAREFFRRTRAWTEWLSTVSTTAGSSEEYTFVLPSGSQLVRIEKATRNGQPLHVGSYRQYPSDWTDPDGQSPALVSRDMVSFHLVGDFAAAEAVKAQVSLLPTLAATGIPDELADRYYEAIAEGAKAIVLMTPGDFFKPDLAAVASVAFKAHINTEAVDAYRSQTNNVPRATPKWC